MHAKYDIINALQVMPETISFDEIKEVIEIVEANRRAMADVNAGRVYTTDEAKRRVRAMVKTQ